VTIIVNDNAQYVRIEFNMQEGFEDLVKAERLTLALMTTGEAALIINGCAIDLTAPCILLLSPSDKIKYSGGMYPAVKTLKFHPALVNKDFEINNLASINFGEIAIEHDRGLIDAFLARSERYCGYIRPMPRIFMRINEWFDSAAREYKMKSDDRWPHRVRRKLMQILFALEEIKENQYDASVLSDESIIDFVIEYIRTNYANEISLTSLCKLVCVNRTSLNRKFIARTRRSPIDYLLHHRLNIACELLTYTKLSVGRIAEATGFNYESYFIRQFTSKIGITPTQYRQSEGYETLNTVESRIVEEF